MIRPSRLLLLDILLLQAFISVRIITINFVARLWCLYCRVCNSRLLRSHMRLKKNRSYNHWLKSQGHYLSCFSTSKRSGPIRFACDMRLKTRYSLKATTKIPPTLENKNVLILRSQNTQNTQTPLKTGSEQSAQLLFIRQ